jgi:hypothetical protein
MNPWALILLLIALLVGTTGAFYLWAHENYTVGVDFNFKAIALAISAAAISAAVGMFIWWLFRRAK